MGFRLPPLECGSRVLVALRWITECLLASGNRVPEAGFRLLFEASGNGLPVAHLQAIDIRLAPAPLTGPVLDRDQAPALQFLQEVAHLTIGDATHRRQAGLAREAGHTVMNVLGERQKEQSGRWRQIWQRPDPVARSAAHLRRPSR